MPGREHKELKSYINRVPVSMSLLSSTCLALANSQSICSSFLPAPKGLLAKAIYQFPKGYLQTAFWDKQNQAYNTCFQHEETDSVPVTCPNLQN